MGELGDLDGAIDLLRPHVTAERRVSADFDYPDTTDNDGAVAAVVSESAAYRLVELLTMRGAPDDLDEAIALLRPSTDGGDQRSREWIMKLSGQRSTLRPVR
jgi:hypothetical protein